jgi:hypothetical protein
LGDASEVYHSFQTATPPDLPMSWKPEEIEVFQDRTTIEFVLRMRKTLEGIATRLYESMRTAENLGVQVFSYFCPIDISEQQDPSAFTDYFSECLQSAATRYIQYEYHLRYMTYMPIVEFSNYTIDKRPPIYETLDAEGKVLTRCELGYPSTYGVPGLEAHLGRGIEEVKKELDSVVSEHEFDVLDDESFYFEPENAHTLRIVASEDLEAGE